MPIDFQAHAECAMTRISCDFDPFVYGLLQIRAAAFFSPSPLGERSQTAAGRL